MNNVFLSLTIAILFGIGTFLILRRDIVKVIIGLTIISHAINMTIVSAGIFEGSKVPIITGDEHASAASGTVFNDSISQGVLAPITSNGQIEFVDPLVQAMALTAIVISLAITAFILILAYRIHEEYGTTDIQELRRLKG